MHRAKSKYIYALLGLLTAAWLGGFSFFIYTIQQYTTPPLCTADAIIVLTGGQDRITAGIKLLNENQGQLLLISGTGRGFNKHNITPLAQQMNIDDLFLGTYAKNTLENAYEALTFMKIHHLHSLCLVTSDYHMPRSSLLFKAILPQHTVIPYALSSAHQLTCWQFTKLLFLEYNKYLYTVMHLY